MPISEFEDAAAEVGREEGLEYCVMALTRTTAFAATSGNLSASMKYPNVESASSTAASLTAMVRRMRGYLHQGAERETTMCGGADCKLRRGCCIMSK